MVPNNIFCIAVIFLWRNTIQRKLFCIVIKSILFNLLFVLIWLDLLFKDTCSIGQVRSA